MSTLSFEYETKDLYKLPGEEELTSRSLDIEIDAVLKRGDLHCEIESIWCCDSHKFVGETLYKLTERDMAAIMAEAYSVANENISQIVEDHQDSIKDYFEPVFGDD